MSSGFVTETEIAEARRKRQEEWERVRSADQPLEAPEEPFDSRSLFDRLQEQKQKKDLEYEEAHKLKNMIKGLDDDEIEFLDMVDRTKLAAERKKNIDEERELNDYRNRVASLQEKSLDQRLQAEINVTKPKTVATSRQSQMKLLKGAVVTKNEPKKRKLSDSDEENVSKKKHEEKTDNNKEGNSLDKENCKIVAQKRKCEEENLDKNKDLLERPNGKIFETSQSQKRKFEEVNNGHSQGALTCIGILPGLGCYNDSSESDVSSDSEPEYPKVDMLGREIKKPSEKCE